MSRASSDYATGRAYAALGLRLMGARARPQPWMIPGAVCRYYPTPGREKSYLGRIAAPPRELSPGVWVVSLDSMDGDYQALRGRSTVPAAAIWCVERAGRPEGG